MHLPDREAHSQSDLLADLEAQHRCLIKRLNDFVADQLVLVDPLHVAAIEVEPVLRLSHIWDTPHAQVRLVRSVAN